MNDEPGLCIEEGSLALFVVVERRVVGHTEEGRDRKQLSIIHNLRKAFGISSHNGFFLEYPDAGVISGKTFIEPRGRTVKSA